MHIKKKTDNKSGKIAQAYSKERAEKKKSRWSDPVMMGFLICVGFVAAAGMLYSLGQYEMVAVNYIATSTPIVFHPPTLNKALYDQKLAYIAQPLSLDLKLEAALLAASTSTSSPATSSPLIPPLTHQALSFKPFV